eukprot:1168508-Prymnesium_polylepis.1
MDASTFKLMCQRLKAAVHAPQLDAVTTAAAAAGGVTDAALPKMVSVHQHIMPPMYVTELAKINVSLGSNVSSIIWDALATRRAMEGRGVAAAVLS